MFVCVSVSMCVLLIVDVQETLDINWNLDIEFSHVLYFCNKDVLPVHCAWLSSCKHLQFTRVSLVAEGLDNEWAALQSTLHSCMQQLLDALKVQKSLQSLSVCSSVNLQDGKGKRILICDATCENVSPAVYSVLMLLKHQVHYQSLFLF